LFVRSPQRLLGSNSQLLRQQTAHPIDTESNPPDLTFFDLYHDNNQRLARCPSATLPWFLPTYVDFIYLNRAQKPVPSRSHHSMTELVQPCPGGLIAAQIENALQSERIGSIFLTRQVPDSTKPNPQRLPGARSAGIETPRASEA
jgi:hypothetical protein